MIRFILLRHLAAFFGALLVGLYLVPILISTAKKIKLYDCPDGKIKKQKAPVPYLGGVAVYLSFITLLAFVFPFENRMLWFLVGTTLLLFVGLIDDLNPLTPAQKLFGQIIAVLCFLKGGFSLKSRFFNDFINVAASGFWMLSVINAFNLVDVMDGLSTTLAIISGVSFLVIALILKNYMLSLLLATLLGALCAFLWFNKPSAKMYLGDSGSLFIGGFIAALPLLIRWTDVLNKNRAIPEFARGNMLFETALSAIVPILLVGLPLLEVTSLVIIRKYKKIPFYSGSPHHFASYLQAKNYSAYKVLLFALISGAFLSLVATLFMFGLLPFWGLCVSGLIFIICWIRAVII